MEPWPVYVVNYGLNVGLFYAFLAALTSWGADKTRLLRLLTITGVMVIYLALKLFANYVLSGKRPNLVIMLADWQHYVVPTIYRGSAFMLLALFYRAATHLAEARLAYFRQQINPHLLFNTLNLIYSKVYRQSPEAGRPVLLLSELMRFSLAETGPDGKVPLSAELEQLENLLEINRSRFDEPLPITVRLPEAPAEARILPLILLTLTENMFKHGQLLRPALLEISVKGNRLRYHSQNLKKVKSKQQPLPQLGLQNIRKRLELAYGRRFRLQIREEGDNFALTLTLPV